MPIFQLSRRLSFPPPQFATSEGLLAIGGDLRPERILLGYRNGIFPWYSEGDPILWWSPDPRMVLYPSEFKMSRSLKRTIRRQKFHVTLDTCFQDVIDHCGRLRVDSGEGTWITNDMKDAYLRLHLLGFAHSVETWYDQGLVGGLYGVALGRCFFGESMFSTMSDASKVALAHLIFHMLENHYQLIDCQMATEHLKSLGGRPIARKAFIKELQNALKHPTQKGPWKGSWQMDNRSKLVHT